MSESKDNAKPTVESCVINLVVNGETLGIVQSVEWLRPAVSVPSMGLVSEYEPGPEATMKVTLRNAE